MGGRAGCVRVMSCSKRLRRLAERHFYCEQEFIRAKSSLELLGMSAFLFTSVEFG